MAVLNPDNWDHDNPRFGDNELISSVGPPCRQWDPLPYVKTWLGRRAAHSTSCMARRYTEEESYFSPLWKMWKSV
ncbi:hypothetical protein KUCAC02_030900 [Chaenocephalus aceratus]|uniref:Uncharacterized protein n=1 Tax=Chaenocephalus aceratus TaxID=36190 RepID=A0ACB9XKB4_CHAAC|nr:hypothetical protein KUCAC02_035700 [Chaenocephalus aceratus]KAI4827511.1 hypothetical protein KUCAC02_030900 [Chaenocephalus aceratus]